MKPENRFPRWVLKLAHCATALLLVLLAALPAPHAHAANWARNYGTAAANSYVNATAADASGNVYIAGNFDGATLALGGVTLTRIGIQDAFVAKLDAGGAVVWAKNYGGAGALAYGSAIAADSSGNVYLGGRFQSANLGTPALTKIGIQDAFALKLDASGNTLWAKNYGGAGAGANGNAIAADGAGNVYLGGYFSTANLTTPALTKIGGGDAYALKLDASGNTLWAKNYGGAGAWAFGQAIAADSTGNVYLGGYFQFANLSTPALTKIGGIDAYALKLDTSGNTLWAKSYSGAGASAAGNAIAADSSGNVYLGGYFQFANLSTPALTKIGIQDAYALKLDASGNTLWAKNYGGAGASAYGSAIAADSSGNVYLGGYFNAANLTTPALTRIGTQDAYALKLDASGNTLWAKNYGGAGAFVNDNAIAADSSGNVYLGGYFNAANLGAPLLTLLGGADALIVKELAAYVPGAPTLVTAAAGNAQATISFSAPLSNGGSVITGYTATCGAFSASGAASPLTVTGLANGTAYTCSVSAANAAGSGPASTTGSVTPVLTSYTAPTATGTGTATASVSGGGASCGFTGTPQFVLPSNTPAGVTFPQGLFNFTLGACTPGSTVTLTVTYPSAVPAGTQYWKYGPTPGGGANSTPHWYTIPATISGSRISFSITDGGLGDDDLTVNGTIVDQGGPGLQGLQGASSIPTLSEWGMILLSGLMGLFGLARMRRRDSAAAA